MSRQPLVRSLLTYIGVTKIYKLTYHATQVMHALFDKESAVNKWQISSRALRDCVEYFGPRTESLSMDTKSGKAIFTSFTEKIMDGKGTSFSECKLTL